MNIALVAHDGRKKEMIEWIKYNYKKMSTHNLFATGTTGKMIKDIYIGSPKNWHLDNVSDIKYDHDDVEFPFKNIETLLSGPLGGDSQISAMIAEGKIDCLFFFCDNLITQGHQQDVSALSRIASLYNIPFATNRTTADMILTSRLFDNPDYQRIIPKCIEDYKNRQL